MDILYTLKESKKLLGVTTRTIQYWDKEGKIRVVRRLVGGGSSCLTSLEKLYGMRSHKYKEVVKGVNKLISG